MRAVEPVRHEDDADDAAGGGDRVHVAAVEVVLDVVHRPHADVRRDDRDAVVDEVVDLPPGDRRAVRDIGEDAALDHALDHGPTGGRQAAREVDARIERADRELALVLGDGLRVPREVVREQVGERDRGHAAVGELIDARDPPGTSFTARPADRTLPPSTVWMIARFRAESTASSSAFERASPNRSASSLTSAAW